MNADIAALRAGLSAVAVPEQAAPMRAYMRGQFDFLGVPTPARRKVSTPWIRAQKTQTAEYCLDLAEQLWRQPEREFQYAAVDLLSARAETLPAASLPRLLTLAAAKPWWDCVDGLAAWVVGTLVRRHRDLLHDMDALSGDADFGCAASPSCTSCTGKPTPTPNACSATAPPMPATPNSSFARP